MTRAAITILAAMLTACAAPHEVCGTLPDGSEFCAIVTTRSPQ
jgi:hypothetical protein